MDMYQYIINRTHEYVYLMDVIKLNFDTTKYLTKNKDLNSIINEHWYPCFYGFATYGGILQEKFDLIDLVKFNTILWNDSQLLNFYLNYGKEKEIK
jgi:hypothetical protein